MSGPGRFGAPLALAALIDAALAEDVGPGDVTSAWTVPDDVAGRAALEARAGGIAAGLDIAADVFRRVDPAVRVVVRRKDGDAVAPGDVLLTVEGRLASILTAERTALNFAGRLSGVATAARRFVDAVAGTGCRVLDTRKTTPGWRALEKRAARAGGAVNHRMGLHDMVLIKENHIRSAGGVREALAAALPRARDAGLEVEIEVTSPAELQAALAGGADRILLDNRSAAQIAEAVRTVRSRPPPHPALEASGGLTPETARAAARAGVDFVSVGAITHSAGALDLTLLVEEP
ncbi:MAG: carboxylating nicotinate-nucleotide diphosphorylase [Gemmatimonadota bacterium]|nr:carboxylating nicotinate-nucleotide diphosphorylase [Gemmatimonadota bacterium]